MNRRTFSGKDFGIHLSGMTIEDHALGTPTEGVEIVEAQCLTYSSNRSISWHSPDKILARHRGAVREAANAVIRFRSEQLTTALTTMGSLKDVTKCRVWITEVGLHLQKPDRATFFTISELFWFQRISPRKNPSIASSVCIAFHCAWYIISWT